MISYDFIAGDADATSVQQFRDVYSDLLRLHTFGFVHGDVRRANMIFTANSNSRLIDFDFCGMAHYPQTLVCDLDDAERHPEVLSVGTGVEVKPTTLHDLFSLASVMDMYEVGKEECKSDWEALIESVRNWTDANCSRIDGLFEKLFLERLHLKGKIVKGTSDQATGSPEKKDASQSRRSLRSNTKSSSSNTSTTNKK